MFLANASLVSLLPSDLAVWVERRAHVEGVTPDALVIVMLRGYRRIVDHADRDRAPVPIVPLIARRAHAAIARMVVENSGKPEVVVDEPIETITEALVAVLADGDPAHSSEIRLRLAERDIDIGYTSLHPMLAKLARLGRLRRVSAGVYARAADAPRALELS